MTAKLRLFLPLFLVLLLTDCTTKELVESYLVVPHVPHEVLGEVVRLTLAYNEGASFSFSIGPWTRPVLIGAGLLILAGLLRLLVQAAPEGRLRIMALALIMGGAVGNLVDRITSPAGVVDFIDIGIGTSRFFIFNVADIGVCVGAILLAWSIWREDAEREARASLAAE
jgi:signal peptidase II